MLHHLPNPDQTERIYELFRLDQQRYDLVLLDLELADSHGLDTFATLRDKASRVPIVVVTGLDDEELGVQAIQLGAQDYLVKGQFASRDLVRAVRYATERQRRDRQTEAVHCLREEIWRMRSSRDIDGVIAALKDILEMLDLSLHRCRVAVVDQAGDSPTVWVHDMSQNGKWEEAPTASVDKLMQVWRGEKPVFRPDLQEEVKSDEEVRCALDLPFSQGVLTLTSALADAYSEQDIASFEPLVETLEEAFIRMKDMQAIEARNHQLEGANEELTHFAYVASHDLQEPLRMVSSYLTLIKRRYEGQLDADADEFIGFAVDGATRMSKMIEGLLTYSRIRTRGGEFTETSSADVFAQVVTGRQHEIDVVGGKVSHASLPRIVADERQFAMLLDHLLDNAIRFRSEAPESISRRSAAWMSGHSRCEITGSAFE